MNFLAHIYLSGTDEQLLIGNFIADFVKGKKKDEYTESIRKGIELHRFIDDFTDRHDITARSRALIRDTQGKYAGVVIDIFYDYFLAKDFPLYHPMPLSEFSETSYEVLKKNWALLPSPVHDFLPFMIERNWLLNYATPEGISRALLGLSRRVSYNNNMHIAIHDLKREYEALQKDFKNFFPLLIKAVEKKTGKSLIQPV